MPAEPVPASQTDYDLLIRNGAVVSVFTGETFPADIAIRGETIAAVLAPGSVDSGQAAEVLDASGLTVAPGYVDAHMHVESSFVTPASFAWLTLPSPDYSPGGVRR
jgi:adenine deaminase